MEAIVNLEPFSVYLFEIILNNVHSTVLSKVFSCKSILNPEITLGMMENINRKQINVNKLHILLIVLKLLIIEVKINFSLLF